MKFSEVFSIKRTNNDDWFDPILSLDSKFFIDPFLVFKSQKPEFCDAHAKMVGFFNNVFQVVALSGGEKNNINYKKARGLLVFPEARELCLGYATGSTKGAGSGFWYSDEIFDAMWEMIKRGIRDIKHFEELGIFNEGIGADRISDMTANLLKQDLILYTQKVCQTHKLPTDYIKVLNSSFDYENGRWYSSRVQLPINPKTGFPIILLPEPFLDDLPEINAEDFWNYLERFENERLRNDLNFDFTQKIDKKAIVSIARACPDLVRNYTNRKETYTPPNPYDFKNDPKYLTKWYDDGKTYALTNPLQIPEPSNEDDFIGIINEINGKYKHFVEFNKGYELLWNDDGSQRSETAVQRSYLGVVRGYCEANNIDISKEANIGRGPVDFKFSKGYIQRTILEIKLANNSHFWDGAEQQLPAYLVDNGVKTGFFMVVRYNRNDDRRLFKIREIIKNINRKGNYKIIYSEIDAAPKLSASRLRGKYSR